MTEHRRPRGATTEQLRDAIDRGATGTKVPNPDPAAAPLGTDDEAAGTPPSPELVKRVLDLETAPAPHKKGRDHSWPRDPHDESQNTDSKDRDRGWGIMAAVIAAMAAAGVLFAFAF